jgi:hypothetical protein
MHDGLDILNKLNGEGLLFNGFTSTFYEFAPDDIEPINGATTILNYNYDYDRDGLHRKGGIAFTGTFGESSEIGQLVYLSFPFEAIDNGNDRNKLMNLILQYFDEIIINVDDENPIVNQFHLFQNYPNPFNSVTTIQYSIPVVTTREFLQQTINLTVYDVLGRQVKILVTQIQKPGNYKINFDAKELSSGVYYYQLKIGSFIQTKKMILLK